MVRLDKIVTKAGDGGTTRLASGAPVSKASLRVEAYGSVDETNACIGVARLSTSGDFVLDPMLDRIQHDLFDLGADLATPETDEKLSYEPLRITASQVDRLEREVDLLNEDLSPLSSFVLPAGSRAAAHLHLARTIARRAERAIVALNEAEPISPEAIKYMNRLSDLLFVAARWANDKGRADVLWKPGSTR